jgi:hypothetical protein
VDKPSAHLPPTVGVLTADDDNVGRYAQVAQSAMQTHGLLGLVIDLWLNDKEVKVAVEIGLSAGMRTEQDHLRARSSCGQAASSFGNQSLVNYLHGPKS